jgi:lon-related putative ATP-dependent protease
MPAELTPGQLKRHFDPEALSFELTTEVEPIDGIIGQPRALEAIRFGFEIEDPTFHVYAAGVPGTGRTKAVEAFLRRLAADRPVPSDWCYVNNFADASRPIALQLEPGRGRRLAADVAWLVGRALRDVPGAFESDEFAERESSIKRALENEREQLYTKLKAESGSTDFLVETGPLGVIITPLINGRPITDELLATLTPAARQELAAKREAIQERVRRTLKHGRDADHRAQDRLDELKREVVGFLVGGLVDDLIEQYSDTEQVGAYLNELRDWITSHADLFERPEGPLAEMAAMAESADGSALRKYDVNVMVDRTDADGAPVVIEPNPTYSNLFGTIEKEARFGALYTDFTLLKPGAMHQANGGYLVLPVRDLLLNFLSYDSLKRALKSRQIEIEEPAERLGLTGTRTLRPAPIPLDLKVVLIGTPLLYHLLYLLDEDFPELFKVKAHFDTQMERTDEAVRDYARFIAALCAQEELTPLDRGALALVVEHSSRLAEDQAKLTAQFRKIADVVREASHHARRRHADRVEREDVEAALKARVYRSNLIEERIQEMIARGTLHIETTGTKIGQVDGLSVLDLGDYSFGRPNRITASIALGQAGVVDIEREAKLGGPVHAKGVMILSGFLADRFARDYPLSLTARLVFEQSYAGVEGDSASGAELVALISRLADLPAAQGIAMTGAVDQQGGLQAIGGVNEKIEGFFDVCRVAGLTGEQGVVIPRANLHNLMLRQDVIEAVESGDFHVWAVTDIQEAVVLLLGTPAGEPGTDGSYPESTVFGRIDQRLRQMASRLAEFGAPRQGLHQRDDEEGETEAPPEARPEGSDTLSAEP